MTGASERMPIVDILMRTDLAHYPLSAGVEFVDDAMASVAMSAKPRRSPGTRRPVSFRSGMRLLPAAGSIQVHATELSQTARGTAASVHSWFFYLGQAAGPEVYSIGLAHGEGSATIVVGAAVVKAVGLV
jgi:predicted MFS family arabinose efflux permease